MPMIKTSTNNDLLKFIYQETDPVESETIRQEIVQDEDLMEEAEQLREIKHQIENFIIKAPQRVVNKILSYAGRIDMESA